MDEILDSIKGPEDLKRLPASQLPELAREIRELIISTISRSGGHLASSLGVVELAIALHRVFATPRDKIIWDVGHQSYAHKILTGRAEAFSTIRQYGGLSGFPRPEESPHDAFGTGHSSTSISVALGLAEARDLQRQNFHVVAIIGDGAMTGGMAFEAMNNAGHLKANVIVILNDNEMSISKNVGAIASYLSRLRMDSRFVKTREDLRKFIRNIPGIGGRVLETAKAIEDHLTYLLVPGVLFEALGFTYLGPFDGHNIELLISTLQRVKDLPGPRLVHVITQKGKGYAPAESDSTRFHGAPPFDIETGESSSDRKIPTYTEVFGKTLVELAAHDPRIVAVTAAMPDGTGLVEFSRRFPDRFFDVGIAEQHAVAFAAALAAGGLRPVVGIYSTFLQRAFDQVIHDVCLQNIPVVLAVDRAGIVGEDGATHQGSFDLSYMRLVPNLVIMAPKDENELRQMLKTSLEGRSPAAIRYPRDKGIGVKIEEEIKSIPVGKAEILREGRDMVLIALGNTVYPSLLASEMLSGHGVRTSVVNARFLKPLDEETITRVARSCRRVFTIEEGTLEGGFGSAVLECLSRYDLGRIWVYRIGLPDCFIEHGSPSILRAKYALSPEGIVEAVRRVVHTVSRT